MRARRELTEEERIERAQKLHQERLDYEQKMLEKGYSPNDASFLASLLGKDTGYSIICLPEVYAKYHGLLIFNTLIECSDGPGDVLAKGDAFLEAIQNRRS